MRFLNSKAGKRMTVMIAAVALSACVIILGESELPPSLRPGLGLEFSDRVALCGLLLSAVVALAAVPQLLSLAETSRSAHYSQLDTMYFELLRMAVEKPFLRRLEHLTAEQRLEYESYAFMIWNFIETVRDRCEDDQTLKDIWAPVIATEHALHRDWFYGETTPYWDKEAPKFRLPFADFIWSRFGSLTAPVCGNALHTESAAWIRESWKLRTVDDIRDADDVRVYVGEPGEHDPDWPRPMARPAGSGTPPPA
jgi:hypothetical protein